MQFAEVLANLASRPVALASSWCDGSESGVRVARTPAQEGRLPALERSEPEQRDALRAEQRRDAAVAEIAAEPRWLGGPCAAPDRVAGVPPPSPATLTFSELWGRLVRRFAWGADGRRTTARIEIGDGQWSGATIVVTAGAREVAVHIEAPPGVAAANLQERLAERLRERGFELSELTVHQCG